MSGFVYPELVTERLLVRAFRPEDRTAVLAGLATGEEFLTPGTPSDPKLLDTWLADGVHAPQRAGTGVHLVLTLRDSGDLVGAMSLFGTDWEEGRTEVGYGVHPGFRGFGYAPEAVGAIAHWAFEKCGLHRIELRTIIENVASQRVAIKAGFTREGVLRDAGIEADGRHDVVVFGLLWKDLR